VDHLLISVDSDERADRIAGPGSALRAAFPAARIVTDTRAGEGPLAGLEASLAAASTESVFVAACDYPFLEPSAVERLIAALASHDAALPEIGGQLHPLCGCYARGVLDRLRAFLASGGRAATAFAGTLDIARLTERDFPEGMAVRLFTNINTRADKRHAERQLNRFGSRWPA
jgi:molybdopterin-guanine dinucleotide biosynthesis protein A